MIDIAKWKDRYNRNIVTKEMIDTLYINKKIGVNEYLYILDLNLDSEDVNSLLPEQEPLPNQNVILSEKVTALEEKVAILENTVNSLVAADEPQF